MAYLKAHNNIFIYSVIAVLFTLFFLSYFPTLAIFNEYWSRMDLAYGHGYLVLGITIYLLYSDRKNIFSLEQQVSIQYFLISLFVLFISSVLWFSAVATQVQVVQIFSIILMLWLWIAVVFGKSSAIHSLIPIGLLLFAIPLWEGIGTYLQAMTVYVSQFFLSLIGIPAYIDGNFIHLADGTIEVAETCNGYRYFLAGTALSIAFAEMNINTIPRKIGVIILGLFISILANWIRVISLVVIGDVTKMQSSLVTDHELFGWIIFMACFAFFLLLAHRIDPGKINDKDSTQPNHQEGHPVGLMSNYYFRAFTATLIAGLLPMMGWSVMKDTDANFLSHQLQLEQAVKTDAPEWQPNYSGFKETKSWRLAINNRNVEVSIISYINQKQGEELIYYSNRLNRSDEKLVNIGQLNTPDGFSVNRAILIKQSKKRLVAWYYKVGNFNAINRYMAKLLQIPAIIEGSPIASLVTISVECKSIDCSNEEAQILTKKLIEKVMLSIKVIKPSNNKP